MPTTVKAYAVLETNGSIEPVTIERRDVGAHDVQIDIQYCGICHSDMNFVKMPLPESPLVLGHEIVGEVTAVGEAVTKHAVGDRVGIGCMVNSCRECANCLQGQEQYCLNGHTLVFSSPDRDGTMTQGGYSEMIVANEDFVVKVPAALDPAAAAPLLCAGATVFAPLKDWKVGPGSNVAIIGLGGLGHLAVKFAKAKGAVVTALSRSDRKRDDALRLGADAYFATAEQDTFKTLANSFDLVINTVSGSIDVDAYLGLLALGGTLVNAGIDSEPVTMNVYNVIRNRRSYTGTHFGGITETQEMLDFAAEHGVTAEIEMISANQINEAYQRILDADVRYRFVLDNATLTS
ncbi:NAD(P)-dependent alcohol dehydrogenase [Kineosporia sp. J2-2]|uniref:alcohol dehydrogenase (NADP(+)) n=1 Tax=Kineosporia corallincola TaxID=2835133 RepID=A0ABS5TTV4_9ACTN|nr:NAD(P)-dependent alcohol dehydrogenase [Kineosporia corallincola]MBT0774242.1 NAD(P)-dependent alcohol dehydrogenase [Kineosporia corallincola]